MLTRSIRPSAPVVDIDGFRRALGEVRPPDGQALVRRLTVVPDQLETAAGEAGQVLRTRARLLPWSRPRRRRPGWTLLARIALAMAALGTGAWVAARVRQLTAASAERLRLDADALDRATGEGMHEPFPGATARPAPEPQLPPIPPVPPTAAVDARIVRPTAGMGRALDG